MQVGPGFGTRLIARVVAYLRLCRAWLARQSRTIVRVASSLVESEHRPRPPVSRQHDGARSVDMLPTLALYLWLAVVAIWMVGMWEALERLGR
jgi:hypothetical protein